MSQELFDTLEFYGKPLAKDAASRNAIGDFAEEFVCRVMGLDRLKIDGRKNVCSDAKWDGNPVEIKSVGKNGRALLYKWRAEKEMKELGPFYTYVFVCHKCPITVTHSRDVVKYFIDHPPTILMTTLGHIMGKLKGIEPRKFKLHDGKTYENKYGRPAGFNRKGYIDGGWQFSLKILEAHQHSTKRIDWFGTEVEVPVLTTAL